MIDTIKRSEKFAVLTHIKPDIDAVSSAMAIYYFLLTLGKKSENIDLIFPSRMTKISEIGGNILKRNSCINNYDLVIIVDCNEFSRVSGLEFIKNFNTEKCIVFDHHEVSDNQIPAKFSFISGLDSSCTCILYKHFINFFKNSPFMNDFITCIVRGLLSDTRFLQNSNSEDKELIDICSKFVDIDKISSSLKSTDKRTQELIFLATQRFCLLSTTGCSYLLQEDLQSSEKNLDEIDHKLIIEELPSCETVIFLLEKSNGIFKGSIRTKTTSLGTDAFCLYMKSKNLFLTGGGHKHYSAGFTTIGGDVNSIFSTIATELENFTAFHSN